MQTVVDKFDLQVQVMFLPADNQKIIALYAGAVELELVRDQKLCPSIKLSEKLKKLCLTVSTWF